MNHRAQERSLHSFVKISAIHIRKKLALLGFPQTRKRLGWSLVTFLLGSEILKNIAR